MEKLNARSPEYTAAELLIVEFGEGGDVISTSTTLGFDGAPNYDSGAWT